MSIETAEAPAPTQPADTSAVLLELQGICKSYGSVRALNMVDLVVRAGEHVALVIASWPMGAPPEVIDDVDSMIGSLGPIPGALPPGVF